MTSEAERQRAREILDLQEGRGRVRLLDDRAITELFETARRIAIVGASPNPGRPSYGVMAYLMDHGYECVPVNPNARDVLGMQAFSTLVDAVDASGPVQIVDIFRRSELCVPHAEEAVAVGAPCLWLQIGIVNWEAAQIAAAAGLGVVMDRCTKIEHARLIG